MSSGSLASSQSWLFARIWGGFLLVLVMATYPLWFPPLDPQSSLSVPLITGISSISGGWALVPSITLLFGLVIAVSTRESARMKIGWIVVAASLLLSFLLDQHRLQPWAYQSFFYALIFSSMSASAGHKWIMPLAASVYLYSAAGKFDFQFQHTVGQDLMAALAGFLGGLPDGFNAENAARLALLLPAVEFVAGVGLGPLGFIIAVMALIFVLGMFLEAIAIILITTPILLPTMIHLGIDPIWYGILLMVNLELAMITPPVGMNLFVIKGITDQPLSEVVKGAAPFVVLMLAGLALLIFVPSLATWLPYSAGFGR